MTVSNPTGGIVERLRAAVGIVRRTDEIDALLTEAASRMEEVEKALAAERADHADTMSCWKLEETRLAAGWAAAEAALPDPSEKENGSSATDVATSPNGLTEAQHSAGWRDIATAPRDGTPILAYNPMVGVYNTAFTTCWTGDPDEYDNPTYEGFPCGFWALGGPKAFPFGQWDCGPSHWMSPPDPPDSDADAERLYRLSCERRGVEPKWRGRNTNRAYYRRLAKSAERGPVTAVFLAEREDGGLRVWSDDEPGLILSGRDADAVSGDIWRAIKALREYRLSVQRSAVSQSDGEAGVPRRAVADEPILPLPDPSGGWRGDQEASVAAPDMTCRAASADSEGL